MARAVSVFFAWCATGCTIDQPMVAGSKSAVPSATARECTQRWPYTIKGAGRALEEGHVTHNFDCCNTDADCATSAYGRFCVAHKPSGDARYDPMPGFSGFCQECDQKRGGCPAGMECHWGLQDLLSRTATQRMMRQHGGGLTGIPMRSVYFCDAPYQIRAGPSGGGRIGSGSVGAPAVQVPCECAP